MTAFTARSGVNIPTIGFTGTAGDRYSTAAFDAANTDARIGHIKACGFDAVRLTFDPSPLLGSASDAALAGYFAVISHGVDRFLAAGLKVIVDNHVSGGDEGWTTKDVESDDGKFQRLRTVMGRLAVVLGGRSPAAVALEQYNEPTLPLDGRWPPMAHDLWRSIRGLNPRITILVAGTQWADRNSLAELDPAQYDENTGFVFHDYEPAIFTGQGIPSLAGGPVAGLRFPADRSQKTLVLKGQDRQRRGYLDSYFGAVTDAAAFAARVMAPVTDWCDARHVARDRIFMTEFGVSKYAPLASRLTWLRSTQEAARQAGFMTCLWSYDGDDVWDVTDGTWVIRKDVLAALGLPHA